MNNKLKNKVAIITGASKGIGASIAKHFAEEGAKVVVNYASSKEGADKVVKAITDNGGRAIAVQGDVSKEADVIRLFEETKKAFGTLDILVNNAAHQQYLPIGQVSVETFHQHFNVNVLGAILAIQASLKLFSDKGGNIINISSGASKYPLPGASLYSATKAALDAVTIALSKELGAKDIRINSILPGATETEGARSAGVTTGSEYEKMFIANTPLGRRGQPEDIAKAAGLHTKGKIKHGLRGHHSNWSPRNEADAEFFADFQNAVALRAAFHERILALDRSHSESEELADGLLA